jgi:UDP-N-acetylglucosamine transferase subunit ALG13
MILVTVGMHNQGFDRLIRAADELASQIDEKVYIQYGSSNYVPLHAECSQWTTSSHMEQLTGNARIVITHAAAGAIILAITLAKPLVVVPRAKGFREHIDDHQQQLARVLSECNQVISVAEPTSTSLKQAIDQCTNIKPTGLSNQSLIQSLKQQLNQWNTVKTSRFKG